jgi:mannose/cellobiose epimerase-like protein (N-acyl-D-glucosamine 2-epimerase family)
VPSLFRSERFLRSHVRRTMAFYHPRCLDPAGGCFHLFKDDGTVYDRRTRHLVSSARFVFNYASAARHFGDQAYLAAAKHCLDFLDTHHRDPDTGGYAWLVDFDGRRATPLDTTRHAYGLAFVLLAYAHALSAGIAPARDGLERTFDLLERHFWLADVGLYADEASPDFGTLSPYRGQNANMHACEALIAAYRATGERRYLGRAATVADGIARRQAALADGLVWEHYREDWTIDWDYHRDDPANLFRPWGFQPGHQAEWAKLLLTLERLLADTTGAPDWLATRAVTLFDTALARAWDPVNGGIHYGFAPDGSIRDADKYFWVQAESIAAAAMLAVRTGEARYWAWYDRLWAYAWNHFVDHRHGAWYRILTADNRSYGNDKSPAGKTDYHTMGACYDVLETLRAGPDRPR